MTSLPTIQMQGAMVRMEAVTVAITVVKDTNNRLLQPGVVLVGVAHLGGVGEEVHVEHPKLHVEVIETVKSELS